jgi:hypothetical protein
MLKHLQAMRDFHTLPAAPTDDRRPIATVWPSTRKLAVPLIGPPSPLWKCVKPTSASAIASPIRIDLKQPFKVVVHGLTSLRNRSNARMQSRRWLLALEYAHSYLVHYLQANALLSRESVLA